MSVKVRKEPDGLGPLERCCMCGERTEYWYGTGKLNVALCRACAERTNPRDIPTKAQWFEAQRR